MLYALVGILSTQCLFPAMAIAAEPHFAGGITKKAQWLITVGLEGSGHHGFCDSGYLAALFHRLSSDVDVNNIQTTGGLQITQLYLYALLG